MDLRITEPSLVYARPNEPVPPELMWAFLARAHRQPDGTALRVAIAIARAHGLAIGDTPEAHEPAGLVRPARALTLQEERILAGLWRARLALSTGPAVLDRWLEGHPFVPGARHLASPRKDELLEVGDAAVEALAHCLQALAAVDRMIFEILGVAPTGQAVTVERLLTVDSSLREVIGLF